MTCNVLLKLSILIYPLCKVRIPLLHLHPELWTCLHKYPLPAIDSRMETDPTVKITIPTILGQPYMHIPWSKIVYKVLGLTQLKQWFYNITLCSKSIQC